MGKIIHVTIIYVMIFLNMMIYTKLLCVYHEKKHQPEIKSGHPLRLLTCQQKVK